MLTIFGSDVSWLTKFDVPSLIKFVLILIAILAVISLFYVVLRKMTGARLISSGSEQGRNRQQRLGVVDVYDLDRARQLVLLRRDNVEHLLLIGGPNDAVIETNIVQVSGSKLLPHQEAHFERAEQLGSESAPARPMVESPARRAIGATATSMSFTRPGFAEASNPSQPAMQVASQAVVSAVAIAAVAATTQQVRDEGTGEVPDFLHAPHGRKRSESKPRAFEASEQAAEIALPEPEHSSFTPPLPAARQPEPVAAHEPPPAPAVKPKAVASHEPVAAHEPPPTPVEMKPEPAEERWSRNTPFVGIDTSIGDYTRFRALVEEQNPASEEAGQPMAEYEPEPVEAKQAPAAGQPPQIDKAIFSDIARQLEALMGNLNTPAEAAPDHRPEPETKARPAARMKDAKPRQSSHDRQETREPARSAPVEQGKPETRLDPELLAKNKDPFSLNDIEAEFARILGRAEAKSKKA